MTNHIHNFLKACCSVAWLMFSVILYGQDYTSYIVGDTGDVSATTQPVYALMGGASENDSAMVWFLEHTGGGDIVVLKTEGGDDYNNYLFSQLGVTLNSVETIVCHSPSASNDPYIINQLNNAEGVWIAGGNQATFLNYWKDTPVENTLNYLINEKQIPVGGISAGMAIMGSVVFTRESGDVVSPQALLNPYNANMLFSKDEFLQNPLLQDVITDTHYNNPDRRGRHVGFLARIAQDYGISAYGIACNEYTAVCIDSDGNAFVFGEFPAYEDYAYFIQVNCLLPNLPEVCTAGQPLTWNRNQQALLIYKVPGTVEGSYSFRLSDWETGTGGEWENWYVNNGQFYDLADAEPESCIGTNISELPFTSSFLSCFPNPATNMLTIELSEKSATFGTLRLISTNGQVLKNIVPEQHQVILDINSLNSGVYFLQYTSASANQIIQFHKQ
ncbi:MAG: Type 1 glutamine amidotransferase-like domain-containing protein [Sphingobacteriales bacterium]|nr:MAG: Type 1 glutamine amidotransferase-like domain-containing protein [Sphingobacteriales bacterium]